MHDSVKNANKIEDLSKTNDEFSLIKTIQEGDKNSFYILVDRYREKIRNLIYFTLSDRNIVDDLAQDVFIKVYESIDSFRFESTFYTWLYRITVNKCRDEIRKKKLRKITSLDFIFEKNGELMNPQNQFEKLDNNLLLTEAMSKLSLKEKEIITLKDINELTYHEIAEVLDCNVGTIKSRLARARMKLSGIVKNLVGEYNVKEAKNKASLSVLG